MSAKPAEASPKNADEKASVTTVTPTFKMVFLTVFGITAAALLLNVFLVIIIDTPNDPAKSLMETCSTLAKAGFGAIVGLIGGKAV